MKAYVISLKDAVERRKVISQRLKNCGVDFEFVDAVWGADVVDNPQFYSDKCSKKNEGRSLTCGEVGCALSHASVYKKIAESNEPYALIMEDDAVPSYDLPIVLQELSKYLNGKIIIPLERCDCYKKKGQIKLIDDYTLVNPYFIREGSIAQASGYVITKEAAQAIKDINFPVSFPADSWGHYKKYVTFYGIIPSQTLIYQDEGFTSQTVEGNCHRAFKKRTAINYIIWALATENPVGRLLFNIYKSIKKRVKCIQSQ